jgi:uncharacterized membrane protein
MDELDADCHLVMVLATVSFACVLLLPEGDTLRAVMAFPFLAFFPGYLAVSAIFFNKRLDPVFHIVMGVVLSVVAVTLIALCLGIAPEFAGIKPAPAAALIYLFTLSSYGIRIAGSISLRKRQRYAEMLKEGRSRKRHRRVTVPQKLPVKSLSVDYSGMKMDAAFAVILVAGIIIAGWGFYVVSKPQEVRWTWFNISSSDPDNPLNLTKEWSIRDNMSLLVELVNHEKKTVNYTIAGNVFPPESSQTAVSIFRQNATMADGQSLEWDVPVKFIHLGKNTVKFSLYKENVYDMFLQLIVTVK